MDKGISVIICCHNSAKRLDSTLSHLITQHFTISIPWEIIIIDNASTDDTYRFALNYLEKKKVDFVPYRVIREARLGLSYARERGFHEARYEYVCFIDDDNWISPDWIQTAYQVMETYPKVGACGGKTEAVYEVSPPHWFERHKSKLAIGNQYPQSGDVTDTRGYLWGAGLVVRKDAWKNLQKNGFKFYLTGRKGKALLSGEDSELCFALRMSGWRLWYEENLSLKHFIPSGRLTWQYLRKLMYGFGLSSVYLSSYRIILRRKNLNCLIGRSGKFWIYNTRTLLEQVWKEKEKWIISRFQLNEGDDEVLELDYLTGRLTGFLREGNKFDQMVYNLAHAPWNLIGQEEKENALSHID